MVRGSIGEKSHEVWPSCGCKPRSGWKTRLCILEPRRSGGLTTTCKDAVVLETRATESQEILTEGGASVGSEPVWAAAGCDIHNRSIETTASALRIISATSRKS